MCPDYMQITIHPVQSNSADYEHVRIHLVQASFVLTNTSNHTSCSGHTCAV